MSFNMAGGFLSGKYRGGKESEGESRRKEFDFPPSLSRFRFSGEDLPGKWVAG